MGRVVLTHSTYLEGLIEWSKRLAKNENIKTITPGVIGRTKGSTDKLKIRITRKVIGGFKLIARKGSSFQEVYVVTKLDSNQLIKLIDDD